MRGEVVDTQNGLDISSSLLVPWLEDGENPQLDNFAVEPCTLLILVGKRIVTQCRALGIF